MPATLLHYDPETNEYFPIEVEDDYIYLSDKIFDISTLEVIANSELTIATILPPVTHEQDVNAMMTFAECMLIQEAIKYATNAGKPYVMLKEFELANQRDTNIIFEPPSATVEGLAIGKAILLKAMNPTDYTKVPYPASHKRAN